MSFWSNLDALKSLSATLQWGAIVLVFIGGALQVGKVFVDRRKDSLAATALEAKYAPAAQPLRSGIGTLDVFIRSSEQVHTTYIGSGSAVAFMKGGELHAVLADSAAMSGASARQLGNDEVQWHSNVTLNVRDPAIGRPIAELAESEFIQLAFERIPPNSEVVRGSAVITLNGNVRLELVIPAQRMQKEMIFIRDLSPLRTALK